MKFQKKPVVIDARQMPLDQVDRSQQQGEVRLVAEWMVDHGYDAQVGIEFDDESYIHDGEVLPEYGVNYLTIETLEGIMMARPGDWIIRGIQGEFYPCKPDIFEAAYEPADQEIRSER